MKNYIRGKGQSILKK